MCVPASSIYAVRITKTFQTQPRDRADIVAEGEFDKGRPVALRVLAEAELAAAAGPITLLDIVARAA